MNDATSVGLGEEASPSMVLNALKREGYVCYLVPEDEGMVSCPRCGTRAHAAAWTILGFHRFEGLSDPSEEQVVVALGMSLPNGNECRGAMALAYGPTAPAAEHAVLGALKFGANAPARLDDPEPA